MDSNPEQTWEISDIDGKNRRRVTLAQYRAEIDARKPYTAAIMAAVRRCDSRSVAEAQATMRAAFQRVTNAS